MVALTLRSIAHALGGDVVGRQVMCPGPGHSSKDRSLSVALASDPRLVVVVRSYAGDDWQACRDYVCARLGITSDCDPNAPVSAVARMQARERSRLAEIEREQDEARRTVRALALWDAAIDPHGTPVESYLASRGVPLPDEAANVAIRFHPSCPFAGQRVSAMLCLARDMVTDEPKAMHRTALNADGAAVEIEGHKRLSLGPVGGCAIKITPHANVGLEIGVGEGLETALSLRPVAGPQLAIWSLLSAGNLERLPLLPGVRKVWIAVDHDPAGLKASKALARTWRSAGREAARVIPNTPKLDLNDLLLGGRLA